MIAVPDASTLATAALKAERLLPLAAPLQSLFPGGGLRRGRVVATRGRAALSLALALCAEASRAGAWLALVDHRVAPPAAGGGTVAELGVEAAAAVGVALERVVRVVPDRHDAQGWGDAMAAVLDGFELVITTVPAAAGMIRRVQRRIGAREAAVIVVGDPGGFDVELELRGRVGAWEGIEDGAGSLRRRRLDVTVGGRRARRSPGSDPNARLWLPAVDGGLAAVSPITTTSVGGADLATVGTAAGAGLERLLLDPELDRHFDPDADGGDDDGRGERGDRRRSQAG